MAQMKANLWGAHLHMVAKMKRLLKRLCDESTNTQERKIQKKNANKR
jgi:hypothetical protein